MGTISFKHKKKPAFVASGGAVKAACFHIGVCLALEKKGIEFHGGLIKKKPPKSPETSENGSGLKINTYVGSSAGSMIAAFLASGYSLSNIVESFIERSPKKGEMVLKKFGYTDLFHLAKPNLSKYFRLFWKRPPKIIGGGFESFFKNHLTFGGLFTTHGIEKYLRFQTLPSNRFEDLAADLFVVATQLDYSRKTIFCNQKNIKPRPEHYAIYENSVKISEAVAASTALPPIYQPYAIKFNGEKIYYYDGEIRETLSTHVAKDAGCDLVIASYTHQPYHFHPQIGSLINHGISSVTIQALYQVIEQKIHTSQRLWNQKRKTIDVVNQFFKEHHLPDKKRIELCEILAKTLQFNKEIDYIFIHPRPQDYKLFLADHFNLSKPHMIQIVKSGFKSAVYHLRNYEFQ